MRVSPIFKQFYTANSASMGKAFARVNCRKPQVCQKSCDDVYMKLAEASMRDKKIELELRSMGLIN